MRKIENTQEEYQLTEQAVDEISEKVDQFLSALRVDEKKQLRLRLSIEEILLNWKEFFGNEQKIILKMGAHFRKPFIILETEGQEFNPVHSENGNEWMSRLLSDLELEPDYTYQKKRNIVSVYPEKKKKSRIYWIVLSVLLALLVSACSGMIPKEVKMGAVDQVITPVMNEFFGMIAMLAGPLIFLSVFTGICGIGDMATFSRIGKKVVLRSLGYSVIGTVLTAAVSIPLFRVRFEGGTSTASAAGELFQMILDIFPTNIVDAFLDENTMQIIALAIAFGAASLVVGGRMQGIIRVCEQIQKIISTIMGWLCGLIPVLIFLTILQNVWSGTGKVILAGWKPVLLTILLLGVLGIAHTGWVALKVKPGMKTYMKKIMPAALIGFSTASSSAAFTEIQETAENRLGIDRKFAGFSIPLYMVLMGGVNAVIFFAFMIYMAISYQVSISVGWILTSIVTVTLLSSATPPTAGAGMTIYTVLFAQMGIPSEAIPIVLTLEIVTDFVGTGIKVAMIENEAVLNACNNGLCDKKRLKEK